MGHQTQKGKREGLRTLPSGGYWVRLHGANIYVVDGKATAGPARVLKLLKGKTLSGPKPSGVNVRGEEDADA